ACGSPPAPLGTRPELPPRPPKPQPEPTPPPRSRPRIWPSLRRPCAASTKRTDSSGARCPASNPSSAPSPGPQTGGHGRCTTPGSTPSPRTLWSTSTTELESDEIGRATSELQSRENLVCRLLLEKKKKNRQTKINEDLKD